SLPWSGMVERKDDRCAQFASIDGTPTLLTGEAAMAAAVANRPILRLDSDEARRPRTGFHLGPPVTGEVAYFKAMQAKDLAIVQYWYYYFDNEASNRHYADWESVIVARRADSTG